MRAARPFGSDRTSASARAAVRLTTTTSAGRRPSGSEASACSTPVPIAPAPTTATVTPPRPPGRRASASSTAACENDVVPRAIAVSDRTRLPAWTAWRNSSARTGPLTRSSWARSHARRTWPRTSPSPRTADSSPDATENRWVSDVVVEADHRLLLERRRRQTGLLGQDLLDLVDRVVEPVDDRVDLRPQARRQDDRLLQVRPVPQRPQDLGQLGVADGDPLQEVERDLVVLDAYDDDGQRVGGLLFISNGSRSPPANHHRRPGSA